MPIYDYDHDNRIITIPSPTSEVTVQELVNDIRDEEASLAAMNRPKIADAEGKLALGSGLFTGITLVLVNDWRLAFEARSGPTYEQMFVSGGNLLAKDRFGEIVASPIFPTAFTQVVISQSSSATISDVALQAEVKYLIESQRDSHTALRAGS